MNNNTLFDRIPENFFGILAFNNKTINIKALMVVYEAFRSEWTIRRTDLVIMMMTELDGLLDSYEEDEEISDAEGKSQRNTGGSISANAHALVRKFHRHGWIEIEYGETTFDEMVTVPDYATRFMRIIHEIINDVRDSEYNRYVYGTYSVLKTSSESEQEYMTAIDAAYSQTRELLDKLKMLMNNIKRYHRQLAEYDDMNRILYEHFDDFKVTLADKIYYPIKTFDSVHRYKTPILRYVKDWISTEDIIQKMTEEVWNRERQKKQNESDVKASARQTAVAKMVEIIDIYEGIDSLIQIIDRKNADYTKATIDRIEFLLNTDRSVKGKVRELIKVLASDKTDRWYDRIEQAVAVNGQLNLEERSLYAPRKRTVRTDVRREKLRKLDDKSMVKDAAKEFKDFVNHTYSQKKIYEHVMNLLELQDKVSAKDLAVDNDHDYISTLLGVLNGEDKKSGYSVSFGEGEISKEAYRIPEFDFVKGEKRRENR